MNLINYQQCLAIISSETFLSMISLRSGLDQSFDNEMRPLALEIKCFNGELLFRSWMNLIFLMRACILVLMKLSWKS